MSSTLRSSDASSFAHSPSIGVLCLSLCLGATGCLSSLNKHSLALADATTPVIEQAAAAYRDAEALYDRRIDYEAPARFDDKRTVYDARSIPPLMSQKDIQIRLTTLAAFRCYTEKLVSLTSGTRSPALDAAAKSLGHSLTDFGNTLAPAIDSTFGIEAATASTTQTTVVTTTGSTTDTTTSTVTTPEAPLTVTQEKGITVAAEALAMFLNGRKIKREVPAAIREMDPHLQALCHALERDIDTLRAEEQLDYNIIRTEQTFFLRTTGDLDPERRREQIMKLPQIVREQRIADQRLLTLQNSIRNLALTHTALAAAAQGNNPETLKEKLAELSGAASDLGRFYGTLSSN